MSTQIGVALSEVSQHTSTLRASANSSSSEGSAFQSRASGKPVCFHIKCRNAD